MFKNLPKRKRQLLAVSVLSGAFVLVAVAAVLVSSSSEETYRPGEHMTGITNDLARDIPKEYRLVTFSEVAREAGIDFEHFSGVRSSQLPEDMGSGATWGDYNNDGWPDLYVANLAGPLTMSPAEVSASPASSRLYRNNGDGTFTDVSAEAGVDYRGWANGAAWGDYDDDGWSDLVVTTYGSNVLYRNNGDGTFRNESEQSGIGGPKGFWASATWGDYDRDGYLDLYVAGYVKYRKLGENVTSMHYDIENPASINPSSFAPERNLLFHNRGNGRFDEVALVTGVSDPEGRSLSAAWIDVDEDGWPDLYVANDVSDNVLYRNLGNGAFEDISHQAWVADYRGAMGIAVGDWDGDTDQDMAITHWIAQENALYSNQLAQRNGERPAMLRFMDEADQYGLGQIALDYIGWGVSFLDIDNDGKLDLFVVNGSTLQERDDETKLGPMDSQIFWNKGKGFGFFDVSQVSGPYFREKHVGRGAAFADYDKDGDVDIFIVNHGERGALLRNDAGSQGHWLAVGLEGSRSNRQGIGARIRLVSGNDVQVRQVGAQASYCSQNTLVEHFGLGDHEQVDTLEVLWPSGLRQVTTHLQPNRYLHIVEEGQAS